jgi:hypothetical protein
MNATGRAFAAWSLALAVGMGTARARQEAPPGFNVHRVGEGEAGVFWRGGAPRIETLMALAASARERGVAVSLIDLRHPPTADDRAGRQGRLSPVQEAVLARQLELRYFSVSALDRSLPQVVKKGLAAGDVYMHCMYGVNRTGFATARYARATHQALDRTGLGARDWRQGDAFQARLEKPRPRRALWRSGRGRRGLKRQASKARAKQTRARACLG